MRRTSLVAFSIALTLAFGQEGLTQDTATPVKVPDWSGIWEQNTIAWDFTGRGADPTMLKLAGHPPYNAEWEARYQKRLKGGGPPSNVKACQLGFPAMMESPQPFEVLITPKETMIAAGDGVTRRVYTDGRGHPSADELYPTITGDSIGHWEGATLVIDTISRRSGSVALASPTVVSDAAHFVERLRMIDRNTLEDQITIDDPVAFTAPWHVTLGYSRVTYIKHIPMYDCDNDRIQTVDGKETIVPATK
jgi:hypothetical protein